MTHYNFDLNLTKIEEIEKILRNKITSILYPRNQLGFLEEYLKLVSSGRKTTTIRFRRGMIDYPVNEIIPVVSANSNISGQVREFGWAQVVNLRIIPFEDLDEEDAINDGFYSLTELKSALKKIYGEIDDTELVSIYVFDFLSKE